MLPRCLFNFAETVRMGQLNIGQRGSPSEFVHRIVKDSAGSGTDIVVDFGEPVGCIQRFEIQGIHPANIWGVFLSNTPPGDFNVANYIADPKAYPGTVPFLFGSANQTSYTGGIPKRTFRYMYIIGILKVSNLTATIDMHMQEDIFDDGFKRGQIRQFAVD